MSAPNLTANIQASVLLSLQEALNGNIQATDLNLFITEELQATLAPLLTAVREQYYLAPRDYAFLAGPNNVYQLPERALAEGLQQVLVLDAAGNVQQELRYLEPRERGTNGQQNGFRIEDDRIRILITSPGTTLRLTYFRIPNQVVETSRCPQIQSINTGTNQVQLASSAAVTALLASATAFDFISSTPGFRWLATDAVPTGSSTNTITFSSLPTGLKVGDYLCPAGEAPLAQCPTNAIPYLVACVCCRWLEAKGQPGRSSPSSPWPQERPRTAAIEHPHPSGPGGSQSRRRKPLRARLWPPTSRPLARVVGHGRHRHSGGPEPQPELPLGRSTRKPQQGRERHLLQLGHLRAP